VTLQSSGAISLGNVANELGRISGTTTSLGEAAVRSLAGVASGPISLSSLYGKSSERFWHASLGASAFNYRMLGTDSSGNVYACASTVVFKWSRDGALLWAKSLSGPFFSGGCIDSSGNVYLAGGFYSSNYYTYLAKLDTNGATQWQRSLNGSAQEYWYNAAVDASGNVYVLGYTNSSGGSGGYDQYIAKYNSLGTLQWQRSNGGSSDEVATQIAVSPDGSLLALSGYTLTSTSGGYDALITVISTATPALSWQRSIGSTAYDYGYGVAFDSGNNIYWVANINGTPSLLKISSGAAVQWQLALPTTYGTDGSVQLDPSGSVWVLSGGFGTAAIYKFDSAGSLLLARSVVLDTTTNYANSFGFGGLAVTSAFIVFPFYSALDFSPYGYSDICGAIVKVPPDGSKTGTWSVPGNGSNQGVTYSAWSPSIGASYWGLTYRAFSFVTRSLTGGVPGYAVSAATYSNTATSI
jgi:hypothetical protein